jgi:hypothetical protein
MSLLILRLVGNPSPKRKQLPHAYNPLTLGGVYFFQRPIAPCIFTVQYAHTEVTADLSVITRCVFHIFNLTNSPLF